MREGAILKSERRQRVLAECGVRQRERQWAMPQVRHRFSATSASKILRSTAQRRKESLAQTLAQTPSQELCSTPSSCISFLRLYPFYRICMCPGSGASGSPPEDWASHFKPNLLIAYLHYIRIHIHLSRIVSYRIVLHSCSSPRSGVANVTATLTVTVFSYFTW